MNKVFPPIRLLPPALRNQIAAGEVVERPSSVLKELVENSLDAGATDIAVTLEDGGQALIAVRDNGRGIPAEDLELAVTRHATSKVASFADLLSVASYGFRGEALPSIASVSDMLVESAFLPDSDAADSGSGPEAAFIRVRHGEISERGPSALPGGTLIEVRDLFANVPARLKFLKQPSTEQKRCEESLVRLALARADVAFSLQVGKANGARRDLFRLGADAPLAERLLRIWSPDIVTTLIPFHGERKGMRASGMAAPPQGAQAKGDRILLYVNRRPVNNRMLFQAVRQAYQGMLTSRESPQAVLFLELDPKEVDMNVHPAKTEVRFRDEKAVFGAVMHIIRSALLQGSPLSFASDAPGRDPLFDGPADSGLPPLHADAAPSRPARPEGFWGRLDAPRLVEFPSSGSDPEAATVWSGGEPGQALWDNAHSPRPESAFQPDSAGLFPEAGLSALHEDVAPYGLPRDSGMPPHAPFGEGTLFEGAVRAAEDLYEPEAGGHVAGESARGGYPVTVGSLTCLGQVADTYLVLVRGDTLLLLDQHAAHERVLLHGIERRTGQGESQLLTLPVELPLHPTESQRLQEMFPQLTRLGYSLATGAGLVSVAGVPPLLGRERGLALLRDILADRTDGMADLLHLMACRAAIKAGQRLTADEAAGLLRQWLNTPDRQFCPHGRPTVLAFDPPALEKMFKRKIG